MSPGLDTSSPSPPSQGPSPVAPPGPLLRLQQQLTVLRAEFDRMQIAVAAEVGQVRASAEASVFEGSEARRREAEVADRLRQREEELWRAMGDQEERLLQLGWVSFGWVLS